MSIAIIGARGNMGKRYSAVCSYLDIPWLGFDVDDWTSVADYNDSIKVLLIATPTDTHLDMLVHLGRLTDSKPMLCEKPIVTSEKDLETLLSHNPNVRMVNQYATLVEEGTKDPNDRSSYYDYWNSGKDGIWDFINIIGLADSPPVIRNKSPIWKCQINGQQLNLRDMDHAYCAMVWSWYRNPTPDLAYIEKAHRRVLEGFYVR